MCRPHSALFSVLQSSSSSSWFSASLNLLGCGHYLRQRGIGAWTKKGLRSGRECLKGLNFDTVLKWRSVSFRKLRLPKGGSQLPAPFLFFPRPLWPRSISGYRKSHLLSKKIVRMIRWSWGDLGHNQMLTRHQQQRPAKATEILIGRKNTRLSSREHNQTGDSYIQQYSLDTTHKQQQLPAVSPVPQITKF